MWPHLPSKPPDASHPPRGQVNSGVFAVGALSRVSWAGMGSGVGLMLPPATWTDTGEGARARVTHRLCPPLRSFFNSHAALCSLRVRAEDLWKAREHGLGVRGRSQLTPELQRDLGQVV